MKNWYLLLCGLLVGFGIAVATSVSAKGDAAQPAQGQYILMSGQANMNHHALIKMDTVSGRAWLLDVGGGAENAGQWRLIGG